MIRTENGRAPLVVVALGGNAIQSPVGDASVQADIATTRTTATAVVEAAVAEGARVVITHGNGPQVGNHLLRSELAARHGSLPMLPLDICVADTQGGMGYILQRSFGDAFAAAGVAAVVVSLVTQVLVDGEDPAFDHPSKPIGAVIPAERVAEVESLGWDLVEDARRGGWRRVVPSPDPKEILEAAAVRALVEDGVVVIAAGGGGVPVVQDVDGTLRGVAAVIDKDLASSLLAVDLGADLLLILTDVDHAYVDFGTPEQRALDKVAVSEARRLLAAGQFGSGSMEPKVEALCRFVEQTGREGVITSIASASAALQGRAGTRVVPG